MSAQPAQNYANHKTNDFQLIGAALGTLISVVLALASLGGSPYLLGIAVAILGLCTAVVGVRARAYATRVQDRIVRLEMKLRLHEVLNDSLRARIPELTVRQLVGLRFASDAELPGLVQKVLDEKIEKADDIKKLVQDWQADYLRV